ncbi:ECF transporter S component [Floccifex sp.]|uniref:ECF transporter S component n=1 Tax=Floccifex sp. TaxID=2815810 RepID=UPI003F092A8A
MTNNTTLRITVTALMAALCYVAFTFLQIKIPTPVGYTSFHLGNTFCILAALLLGGVPGGIAGAIGMGIGDILDPIYIMVAPKTLFLKFMIGVITGFVAHKVFHIKKLQGSSLVSKVVIACSAGMGFNIIGEPLVSYLYYLILLGNAEKAAGYLVAAKFITTGINAILAVVIASFIYLAIYPRFKKNGVLEKLNPEK